MTFSSWEQALGRSAVYELLSLAFLYPEESATALLPEKARQAASAASTFKWEELGRALDQLGDPWGQKSSDVLQEEYVEVFGHSVSNDCPQYEGEYDQAHVFQKSHALADLNTFYQAFGVAVNAELKERLDHISVELEFMHLLTVKEAYALLHDHGEDKVRLCQEAQKAFLAQHLATWVRSFVRQLSRKAGNGSVYGSLAHLLETHLDAECRAFGIRVTPSRRTIVAATPEDDLDCEASPLVPTSTLGRELP